MKKKFLLTLLSFMFFVGCSEPNIKTEGTEYVINNLGYKFKIIELDSCEYFYFEAGHNGGLSHKGNCKFCKIRNKLNEN